MLGRILNFRSAVDQLTEMGFRGSRVRIPPSRLSATSDSSISYVAESFPFPLSPGSTSGSTFTRAAALAK